MHKRAVTRLAAFALCSGVGGAPAAAQAPEPPATPAFVQVSATAQVRVPADRAQVRFALETREATASDASQVNARRMEKVVQALRDLGFEGASIETTGYALRPIYSRPLPGEQQVIEGYQATNHIVFTLDDVDAVGRALDAGVDAGANHVAGLSFEATDVEEARLEALRQAVTKARQEAEAMADALGVPLGPPLEVHGGAELPMPQGPMRYAAMAEARDVTTPVEPGEQTVTASVTVRYRLLVGR